MGHKPGLPSGGQLFPGGVLGHHRRLGRLGGLGDGFHGGFRDGFGCRFRLGRNRFLLLFGSAAPQHQAQQQNGNQTYLQSIQLHFLKK